VVDKVRLATPADVTVCPSGFAPIYLVVARNVIFYLKNLEVVR
jgi:hypothetical protein